MRTVAEGPSEGGLGSARAEGLPPALGLEACAPREAEARVVAHPPLLLRHSRGCAALPDRTGAAPLARYLPGEGLA